jgi:hypothetical protein
MTLCHAVRRWALTHPAEYALLYGTPVPGYAAPADTVPPASRIVIALVRVLADAEVAGTLTATVERPVPPALRTELDRIVAQTAAPGPRPTDRVLLAGMAGWTQLFGLVGFEVFGRLAEMFDDPAGHFEHQMQTMADLAGLP